MMGVQAVSEQLFYDFCLEDYVPADHLLRGIDRHVDLTPIRVALKPFYSRTGRPSVDPELMVRMLIIGYTMGIRSVAVPKHHVSGIDHRCVPIPIGAQIDEESAILVNSYNIEGNSTMLSGLAG
jgi:hypothetical protein